MNGLTYRQTDEQTYRQASEAGRQAGRRTVMRAGGRATCVVGTAGGSLLDSKIEMISLTTCGWLIK